MLIGEDGAKWGKGENTAFIIDGKSWVNNHAHIVRVKKAKLLEEYLELVFCRLDFDHLKTRPNGGKPQKGEMEKIKFPLPTVKEQQKSVDTVVKLKSGRQYFKFVLILNASFALTHFSTFTGTQNLDTNPTCKRAKILQTLLRKILKSFFRNFL